MNTTAHLALSLIPENLNSQPIFLCIDDTMVAKSGHKFEGVSMLFDHASHGGSNYLNGHCFVSLLLRVPVWNKNRISYLSVPLGYRMWQKDESKLKLATAMIRQVMLEFDRKGTVIILCDSWYTKQGLISVLDEYANLDLIGGVRLDSAIYDLPPQTSGKRGRPRKRGERLSILEDFVLSAQKIGDYFIGSRCVMTNIFGDRKVMAYVTSTSKKSGMRRLFFSTVSPERLQIFCAWQEATPLNQTGSDRMQYIPLFFYRFRWPIETSYYEQKTFWSLCDYMVRSRKGIEMMVNLINISYCAMKLLPYQDEFFSEYRNHSVQEFRFALGVKIRQQIFYARFVESIETHIKSKRTKKAMKQLVLRNGYHL